MSKDKKKKSDTPCKDWILWWFSLISALINLAIVMPPLPWRYAKQTPYFGSDFVSDRSISLLSVTDNFGQLMLWFKLKTSMCQRAREVSAPSVMALVKSVGLGAVTTLQSKTGMADGVSVGGAVVGCEAWQECKTAANTRCSSYGTVAGLGVGAVVFLLAAVVSSAVCLVFFSKEASVKKKKKKAAAEFNTCVASLFAWVFTTFAALIWIFGSDAIFSGFKTYSYYPYPAASAGYFAVWFTFVFTFMAMFAGWRRQYHSKEEEKDGSGDELAYAADNPYAYGAYGAQPAYGGAQLPPPGGGAVPPPPAYAAAAPPPPPPAYAAQPTIQQQASVPAYGAAPSYAPPPPGEEGAGAEGGDGEHHHHKHHHHKHHHHKHHD